MQLGQGSHTGGKRRSSGPSQAPVLSEASFPGTCSSQGASGALAPAPGLLTPVGGEGLLLRTSRNYPNHLVTGAAGHAHLELGAGVSHTGDSQMEAQGPWALVDPTQSDP